MSEGVMIVKSDGLREGLARLVISAVAQAFRTLVVPVNRRRRRLIVRTWPKVNDAPDNESGDYKCGDHGSQREALTPELHRQRSNRAGRTFEALSRLV